MTAVFFILSALLAGAFAGGMINPGPVPYDNRGYAGPFGGAAGFGTRRAGPANIGVGVGVGVPLVARAQPYAQGPVRGGPAGGYFGYPYGRNDNNNNNNNNNNNAGYGYGFGLAQAPGARGYPVPFDGNRLGYPYGNGNRVYGGAAAPVGAGIGVAYRPNAGVVRPAKGDGFGAGFGGNVFGKW